MVTTVIRNEIISRQIQEGSSKTTVEHFAEQFFGKMHEDYNMHCFHIK